MASQSSDDGMSGLTLAGIDAYDAHLANQPPPAPPAQGTLSRLAGDAAKSLKRGVEEIPGALTGLEDIPAAILTGRRPISEFADYLGNITGFQPSKWAAQTPMSPQYQQSAQDIDQAWKDPNASKLDVVGAYAANPAYTADKIIESVPSLAMGGILGKSLGAVGKVATAAEDGAAPVGTLARTLGPQGAASAEAAANIGSVTAGQQMESYNGPDQAKNAALALGSGVVAAILGASIGQVAQKLGLETPQTAIAKIGEEQAPAKTAPLLTTTAGRTAAGAVVGGVQGAAQGATASVAQNVANDQPAFQGVGQQAVEGGLMGAVMGAGTNLVTGAHPAPEEPQPAPGMPTQPPVTDAGAVPAAPPAPPAPSGPVSSAVAAMGIQDQGVVAQFAARRAAAQAAAQAAIEGRPAPAAPVEAPAAAAAPVQPEPVAAPAVAPAPVVAPAPGPLEAAASEMGATGIERPGDMYDLNGNPFESRVAARLAARAAGDNFEPVQIGEGQYVVRAVEPQEPSPTTVSAPENPSNTEAAPIQDAINNEAVSAPVAPPAPPAATPGQKPVFLRKTLPAMTDDELAQAQSYYPADHPRQAKIAAQIAARASSSTPGEPSATQTDEAITPATQPEAQGAAPQAVTQPKGLAGATNNMVIRQENARSQFVDSATEQFGMTPESAAAALDVLARHGLVTLDPVSGQFHVKHGDVWTAATMARAATEGAHQAKWDAMGADERENALTDAGYTGTRGNITAIGKRLMTRPWAKLPTNATTKLSDVWTAPETDNLTTTPEQQRLAYQKEAAKRLAKAANLRAQAYQANPFKVFLAKHGVALSLANEFAPDRQTRGQTLVRGYGPIFRRNGLQLDELAQRAVEDGYMPSEDATKMHEMIARVMRGERIYPEYSGEEAEAEMKARLDRARELEADANEAPQEAPQELVTQAEHDAGDADSNTIFDALDDGLNPESNVSMEDFLRSMGATEQEIRDEIANEAARAQARNQNGGQPHEVAQSAAPGDSGEGTPQAGTGGAVEGEGLNAEGKIRAAFNAEPRAIGVWHAITVTHNGREQQFLANQVKTDSTGRRNSAIHLMQVRDGRLLAGQPIEPLTYRYRLTGNNELVEEGLPSKATAQEQSAWDEKFGEKPSAHGAEQPRAPAPFEPKQQEFDNHGSRWRITVDRHWKVPVLEQYEPDALGWSAQKQVGTGSTAHWQDVRGDDVPVSVARKASEFFDSVAKPAPEDLLTSPTQEDVLAQQERAAQGEREKAAADAQAEKDAKAAAEKKEIDARQAASAENFQLGQSAEDALSGQRDVFSQPTEPTPKQEPKSTRTPEQIAKEIGKSRPNEDVSTVIDAARKAVVDELGKDALDKMDKGNLMRSDALTAAVHEGRYEAIQDFAGKMPVPVHESDIPLETATRAHAGTSYSPEERGAAAQRQYVRAMAEAWRQAQRVAGDDPVALERAKEAMQELVTGYRKRYLAALASRSRVASAGIVGPAKFPLARNARRAEIAHNRAVEADEYLAKGIARVLKATREPQDNSPQSELDRARTRLEARERLQVHMREANKALRRGDDDALRALGMTDEQIEKFKKGDFAGRRGYPLYELTNNGAEIRRLRTRLAQAQARVEAAASAPKEEVRPGVRIEENAQDDRLRLFFDEKPGPEVIADLKGGAFRWSPRAKAWQRQITNAARHAAKAILDKHYPAADSSIAKEPQPAYPQHYETDLFGNPLPAPEGGAARAKPARAPVRGDVQPAAGLQDTPAPKGEYHTRTIVGSSVERELGTDKITTDAQAAQATRYLYKSAVERFDGIVTDAKGKPLGVVGGFKGAANYSAVPIGTLIGEAVRIPGAARIWFSHNHPSGLAELSNADRRLNTDLTDAFRGSGIEPMGLLAVGRGKYAHIDPSSNEVGSRDIPASTTKTSVPVIERELSEGKEGPSITDIAQAKAIAREYYEKSGGPGLILLSAQNEPIAWVPLDNEATGKLRGTGQLNALYRAVSEAGSPAAFIVHGGELDRPVQPGISASENIAAALKKAEVLPLDSINVNHRKTVAEEGGSVAKGAMYTVADDSVEHRPTPGLKDAPPEDQALTDQLDALIRKGIPDPGARLRAVVPDEATMTAQQKDAVATTQSVADEFGQKVVWVDSEGKRLFNGAVSRHIPGVIFVRADSRRPYMAVLGHELLHQMRKSFPDLYDGLAKRLNNLMTPTAQFDYFNRLDQKYSGRGIRVPKTWDEEQHADTVGDFFTDPKFWQQLAGSTPGLFRRIGTVITNFLDKVISAATGKKPFGSDEFFTDVQAARDAVASAMGQYRDRVSAGADTRAYSGPAPDIHFSDAKPGAQTLLDGEGRPLTVYHGTPGEKGFDSFNIKNGSGAFFTSNPDVAAGYTSSRGMWRSKSTGHVLGAHLSMSNPLEIDALGKRSDNIPVPWQEWKPKVFGNLPEGAVNMQGALDYARLHGHDGLIVRNVVDTADTTGKQKSDVYVAMHPEQIIPLPKDAKPLTVETMNAPAGPITPRRASDQSDVHFSLATSAGRGLTDNKIVETIHDYLDAPGKVSWWHKSVGTMYNLAQRNPAFKPVFETAQNFINDVSYYATEAANMAPHILPKLETWKDIGKKPIDPRDNKAIQAPIFQGTLTYGRDASGRLANMDDLEAKYNQLSTAEKGQMLLKRRLVTEDQLKRWQASKIDVYDGAVNNRFKSAFLKAGTVFTDAELKSEFHLTAPQIALYHEFRSSIDKSIDDTAKSDMVRFGGEDLEPIRDQIMAIPKARDAAQVAHDYLQSLAKEDPGRADELGDTAAGVLDRGDKAQQLQDAGYAPLSRFGKYTVDVMADGERKYFGLFETAKAANDMAKSMKAEYGEKAVTQGTLSQEEYRILAGVTPETLELFGTALGLESAGGSAADKVFQQYIKLTKTNRSAMRRLLHRQGIAGYSEDVGRVLANFVYSNSRATSAGLHIGDLGKAVSAIPKEQGQLKDVAVKLAEYVKNPQQEGQAARAILFSQYLGGSVASALVNMTQPFATSFPYLSQFGGARAAGAEMLRAYKDVASKTTAYDPGLKAALAHAEETGVVSPQEVHQLMAQARGAGSLSIGDGTRLGNATASARNAMSRLSLAWGKVFGVAEQLNRRTTFIAAYRLAQAQGMKNPADFAERAVNETQFIYSKANKMQWGRGAIGGTLMTFKSYTISYLELLHRMYTQGGPEGKKAALLGVGMLFLMGGASGLPFEQNIEDLADGALQRMGYNTSVAKWKEGLFTDLFGQAAGEFVNSGLSGLPGVPIDVSGRLGMGNIIPGTGLLKQRDDHTSDVLDIVGPAGDLAKRIAQGGSQILSGDVLSGLNTMAPQAVRNATQAYDMLKTGAYRDQKGYTVLQTTPLEAAMKAIGFQPASVAQVQQSNVINQTEKGFYALQAAAIRSKWAQGVFTHDQAMVQEAKDDLADWNRKNPDQPMSANYPAIMRKVQQMGMSKAQRIAATGPLAMRRQMRADILARNADQQ